MAIPEYSIGYTATAIVSIRIPSSGDGLATDAERRLGRANDVTSVTVDELRGIEPGLSATVVTIKVTVEIATELGADELREQLASAPGVETIRLAQ